MDVNLQKSNVSCRRGSGACWMVLLEQDGTEALLLQDVLTRRTQRHVWGKLERDGLVSTMTAVNVGAPSRPLSPRTCAGTARATPPLNAVHPSGDVQVVLTCVDSPLAGLNTCNVDMVIFFALPPLPQNLDDIYICTYIHMF